MLKTTTASQVDARSEPQEVTTPTYLAAAEKAMAERGAAGRERSARRGDGLFQKRMNRCIGTGAVEIQRWGRCRIARPSKGSRYWRTGPVFCLPASNHPRHSRPGGQTAGLEKAAPVEGSTSTLPSQCGIVTAAGCALASTTSSGGGVTSITTTRSNTVFGSLVKRVYLPFTVMPD